MNSIAVDELALAEFPPLTIHNRTRAAKKEIENSKNNANAANKAAHQALEEVLANKRLSEQIEKHFKNTRDDSGQKLNESTMNVRKPPKQISDLSEKDIKNDELERKSNSTSEEVTELCMIIDKLSKENEDLSTKNRETFQIFSVKEREWQDLKMEIRNLGNENTMLKERAEKAEAKCTNNEDALKEARIKTEKILLQMSEEREHRRSE
eukprot:13900216-Ditylum_brightwellii.AAC.1